MLTWLHWRYASGSPDERVLEAAGQLLWFFLLRSGEALVSDASPWHTDRVITGADVIPRRNGARVRDFADADEVVLHIKGSKTDQYNTGCTRNLYRTGGDVCPVEACRRIQAAFPERFDSEAHLPLFRYSDGRFVRRQDLERAARAAAIAEGVPPEKMGGHSFRIGGATAMYQAGIELDVIRRFGRWLTMVVHGYLWETHERQREFASKMVGQSFEFTYPGSRSRLAAVPGGTSSGLRRRPSRQHQPRRLSCPRCR